MNILTTQTAEDEKSWTFEVEVADADSRTTHRVVLDKKYYTLLASTNTTPSELITRSFEFLLDRESKESILRKFNLKKISEYFPEYEKEIKKTSH